MFKRILHKYDIIHLKLISFVPNVTCLSGMNPNCLKLIRIRWKPTSVSSHWPYHDTNKPASSLHFYQSLVTLNCEDVDRGTSWGPDSHLYAEEMVQTLRVVFHHSVGLLLLFLVPQFDISFEESVHIFYHHFLMKLADQLLKMNQKITNIKMKSEISVKRRGS